MKLTSNILRLLLVLVTSMTFTGCATPFKKIPTSTKIDLATASRVTVNSVMPPGVLKSLGVDFVPAKVSLNGEFVGDFSKNEKTFSYEVNQGSNTFLFCADSCYEHKMYVTPNTHYFLQYEQDRTFAGVMIIYKHNVKVLRAEPYQAQAIQKNSESK